MKSVEKLSDIDQIIEDSKQALRDYVVSKGRAYPTDEWVTVAKYCKMFNIENTQTVSNWIKRGIIPAEDTVLLEDLNNIRLIKAIKYHE
jgi:hypothetical protein